MSNCQVLFYHLEKSPCEVVLYALLEKSIERGWRCVIQTSGEDYSRALDTKLWNLRDDGFLPHAMLEDGRPEVQPVLITHATGNENNAKIRFLVDAAETNELAPYERVVYLFDGLSEPSLEKARVYWKRLREAGEDITYWRQSDTGGWEQQA